MGVPKEFSVSRIGNLLKNVSQKRQRSISPRLVMQKQDSAVEEISLDLSIVKKERSRINKISMHKETSACSRGSSCGSTVRNLPSAMSKNKSSSKSSRG